AARRGPMARGGGPGRGEAQQGARGGVPVPWHVADYAAKLGLLLCLGCEVSTPAAAADDGPVPRGALSAAAGDWTWAKSALFVTTPAALAARCCDRLLGLAGWGAPLCPAALKDVLEGALFLPAAALLCCGPPLAGLCWPPEATAAAQVRAGSRQQRQEEAWPGGPESAWRAAVCGLAAAAVAASLAKTALGVALLCRGAPARDACAATGTPWTPRAPSPAPHWEHLESAPPPPVGTGDIKHVMEDFEILRFIGEGSFGTVFEVRNLRTGELLAMKRLSKDFYAKKGKTANAIREIAMMRAVPVHPCIVALFCAVESPEEWALVMELCPGGDLQQLLLAEGLPGLPLGLIAQFTSELALGIEHFHQCGIAFRDVKLENVVLDADGHAKLTDFGLAKLRDDAEEVRGDDRLAYGSFTSTFCGSHGYAPPEVMVEGSRHHGFAVDLFALGVLVYMLLTGGEVHRGEEEVRLPPEDARGLRELLGGVPFELYSAGHGMLGPAGSRHRVEMEVGGALVVASAPLAACREPRQDDPHDGEEWLHWLPPCPPPSPRSAGDPEWEEDEEATPPPPPGPPAAAFPPAGGCAADGRRWSEAVDLVLLLSEEEPVRRGTARGLREHPFLAAAMEEAEAALLPWRRGPRAGGVPPLRLPGAQGAAAGAQQHGWCSHYAGLAGAGV
ncbi:unnamed protein product, partial [Prorocentrum cordatum]